MKPLTIFLSILFLSNFSYATESDNKLSTFDKETSDEFYSNYNHLDSKCSKEFVEDLTLYFYKQLRDVKWESCEVALNDAQKLVWAKYWAYYAWNLFKPKNQKAICDYRVVNGDYYFNMFKGILIDYLFVYVGITTSFNNCAYNPDIKNAVGE